MSDKLGLASGSDREFTNLKINKREPENQRTRESTKLRINKRAFTDHVIKPRLDGLALALWNLRPGQSRQKAIKVARPGLAYSGPGPAWPTA